ncbi:MAG: hypothetical protein ABSA92_04140 [Candidatus Bathyarchaeia archaeon]
MNPFRFKSPRARHPNVPTVGLAVTSWLLVTVLQNLNPMGKPSNDFSDILDYWSGRKTKTSTLKTELLMDLLSTSPTLRLKTEARNS